MATMLPKYLELSGFFEQNKGTNWSVLKCYQGKTNLTHLKSVMLLVLPHKKTVVCKYHNIILSYDYRNVMLLYFLIDDIPCKDCGIFVVAYAEYLSDGLQVPSCGISADTLRLRYASLLWNYGIVKARNGYVSDNENPEMRRPKKSKDR